MKLFNCISTTNFCSYCVINLMTSIRKYLSVASGRIVLPYPGQYVWLRAQRGFCSLRQSTERCQGQCVAALTDVLWQFTCKK